MIVPVGLVILVVVVVDIGCQVLWWRGRRGALWVRLGMLSMLFGLACLAMAADSENLYRDWGYDDGLQGIGQLLGALGLGLGLVLSTFGVLRLSRPRVAAA